MSHPTWMPRESITQKLLWSKV